RKKFRPLKKISSAQKNFVRSKKFRPLKKIFARRKNFRPLKKISHAAQKKISSAEKIFDR
ncbi:MAG: hypothetical protein IJG80_04850, partial [Selenomonadaceae bacterium]|nr:hypothetical protein [Selenomonadaceae bacterium]